jgi:hypothetical protein
MGRPQVRVIDIVPAYFLAPYLRQQNSVRYKRMFSFKIGCQFDKADRTGNTAFLEQMPVETSGVNSDIVPVLPTPYALDDEPFSPPIFLQRGNDYAEIHPDGRAIWACDAAWFFKARHYTPRRVLLYVGL